MPRNQQPRRIELPEASSPYYGEYSALAQQFLRPRANQPIHSVGQGIVEAGADIAEAWLAKKGREREERKEERLYSAVDMANQFISNPDLRRDGQTGALWDKSDFAAPVFDQRAISSTPTLDARQRSSLANEVLKEADPKLAAQRSMSDYELALQFDERAEKQNRESAAAEALGGFDPKTGITWNSGRRVNGETRYQNVNGAYMPVEVPSERSKEMQLENMGSLMRAFPDQVRAKQLRDLGFGAESSNYGQPVAGTDAKGNPVFRRFDGSNVAGEDVPDFFPSRDDEPNSTQAEREVQQLIKDGMDPSDAADVAYNRVRVSRSPVDGSILLVNIRDGSARTPRYGQARGSTLTSPGRVDPTQPSRFPPPSAQAGAAPPPVPGRSAMPGEQVPAQRQPLLGKVGVLGGMAPVQEATGRLTMGGYDPGAALNEARQEFRLFENDVYDMLGGLDRMSNQDRERVQKMFADPGIFESQTRSYDLMSSWSREAQNIVAQQSRVFNDPTQPPELRKGAAAKVEAANRLMERVGDPSQIPRPGSGTGNIGQMGLEQLQQLDPSRMSPLEIDQAEKRWEELSRGRK